MVKINLLAILEEEGITQSRLAELTGIRPATIHEMCRGTCAILRKRNFIGSVKLDTAGRFTIIKYKKTRSG